MIKSLIFRTFGYKALFWLIVAVTMPGLAWSSDIQKVTAEGSAIISGDNVEGAKKAALRDAKRNAVDQVGSEIVSKTVVEDFELVKDQIISKASGFVHAYKVLNGSKKGSEYFISIEAEVSANKMADEAKLIYEDMDKPRVMVLVPQIRGGSQQQSRSIETQILAFFREKGFEIVDANTVQANIRKDEKRLLADGDPDAAAKIALRSGAEVVILGDIEAGKPVEALETLYSATANLSLRAIQASNAKILAAESTASKIVQATPDLAVQGVLRKAAAVGQKKIFSQIVKTWTQAALNGQRVEIKLSNIKKFSVLKHIKSLLSGVKGVSEVQQRSFEKPVALFDVTYMGSAERLGEMLDGKTKSGVAIEITGLSAGALVGRVK